MVCFYDSDPHIDASMISWWEGRIFIEIKRDFIRRTSFEIFKTRGSRRRALFRPDCPSQKRLSHLASYRAAGHGKLFPRISYFAIWNYFQIIQPLLSAIAGINSRANNEKQRGSERERERERERSDRSQQPAHENRLCLSVEWACVTLIGIRIIAVKKTLTMLWQLRFEWIIGGCLRRMTFEQRADASYGQSFPHHTMHTH